MGSWRGAARRLRDLLDPKRAERELDDELRAYVDLLLDEKVTGGVAPAEARRQAMAEVGGTEQVKQAVRDGRRGAGLAMLGQDVRFGLRQLWRNPGFTATVVVTLALAIGANTAIFSVVNALLLKGLPYAHPERLATIGTRVTGPRPSDERHHLNGEQWELLRDEVPSLLPAASSMRSSGVNLQYGKQVRYLQAGRISAHYLDVLGIRPLLGRNMTDEEDRAGGARVAILSYGLWRNTFGADRGVLGRAILLKGEPYTVVGVLADAVTMPIAGDLFTPLQLSREGEGGGTNFEAIARLQDGATWQGAEAELNHAWSLRAHPYELENNPGAKVTYYLLPLQKGETATLRPQVLALMICAGLILLIACANLAGLLLARVLRRVPEMATRMALGASTWRIQRQLWAETLLFATMGGMAGVGLGVVALRGLLRLLPEHFLPVADVSLDGRVLLFATAVSLATSVLFGMLPALMTRRLDLRSALARRPGRAAGRLHLRELLIVGEVALTTVLLAASGLLIRTLLHLETMPPGFHPEGVMTARLSLDDVRYHDAAAFQRLLRESLIRMRQIPGVSAAAVGLALPYERSLIMAGLGIGDGEEAGQKVMADEVYVTPDYFRALEIPLLAGRSFADEDGPTTQPVVIVNRAFARKFFHHGDAVGRILGEMRVVGVVEDVAIAPGIDAVAPLTGEETMYVPAAQMGAKQLSVVHMWFQPSWIVRTGGPVAGLTALMQRALAGADPNLPFSGFYSMHDVLAKTLAMQRVEVALLGGMAGLALLLSGIGVLALVSNTVAQRTREIGIRMALGSSRGRAMMHAGTPGVGASAVGLAVGLALCAVALRAMRSVLFGVGVYDAPTVLLTVLLLAGVALLATIVPTLRIVGIDPAETLREE